MVRVILGRYGRVVRVGMINPNDLQTIFRGLFINLFKITPLYNKSVVRPFFL